MAILIDTSSRVLVQGITGREGMARTKLMKDYGTNVVAGVTPGRGGQEVHGVPVFNSVREAWDKAGPFDVSAVFVPAHLVKSGALEALEAGVGLLVLVPDRVPIWDVLEIARLARDKGARFVGPNTLGVLSPGRAVCGMIGGTAERAREWFKAGPVGVSSRSGGMTSSLAYYLSREGIGQSTIIHVGGDAVVGLSHPEVLELFEKDPETRAVAMFGEIGTTQEERVAELIEQKRFTKPLIAFIGGKAAKSGTRFSHAGAIVEGTRGSYETKVRRLREAGAHVVDTIFDIPGLARRILGGKKEKTTVDLHWKTGLTDVKPNKISLRGYPVDGLMGRVSFAQAVYLLFKGEFPSPEVGRLIDAVLVSSIDHGASPPSALTARTVASTGSELNAAVAAGVLAISRWHGGAVEEGMRLFLDVARRMEGRGLGEEAAAEEALRELKTAGGKASGFGHRLHTKDPRTAKLFSLAEELNLAGRHVRIARAVEAALARTTGKPLPINVDGAIAALLCDLGFPPELGNAFFIIARLPGLVAHVHEERTRMKPMRKVHPEDFEYDGPADREV